MPPKNKQTYSEAVTEIEAIVLQIENGELDMDLLTEKVKRAGELIAFCKKRLTKTESDIEKLLDNK